MKVTTQQIKKLFEQLFSTSSIGKLWRRPAFLPERSGAERIEFDFVDDYVFIKKERCYGYKTIQHFLDNHELFLDSNLCFPVNEQSLQLIANIYNMINDIDHEDPPRDANEALLRVVRHMTNTASL